MSELGKAEALKEAQKTLNTLYSNGTLPRSEEEANFLHIFRELSSTNKISIISRIQGI